MSLVPAAETAVEKVYIVDLGPFHFDKQGLHVDGEPAYDLWAEATERLTDVNEFSTYWLAHLVAYGESRFGEKYLQVMKATGQGYSTWANNVSVIRTIPPEDWRLEDIKFEGHRLLAMIPDRKERNELRDEAIAGGWNTTEIRRAVEMVKGHAQPVDFQGTVREEVDGDEGDIRITPMPGTDRTQIHPGVVKVRLDYFQQ